MAEEYLWQILVSAFVALLSMIPFWGFLALKRRFFDPDPPASYRDRLRSLTASLTRASKETDEVLAEVAQIAREREQDVRMLEEEVSSLEKQENDLKEKIGNLEKLPLPVAEHFAQLVEVGHKRSARRDYLLFVAGVLLTTAVAIALQVFLR